MYNYNKNIEQYAKENRHNMTRWECSLWFKFLQKYPIRVYRQKVIGNYIADFYCAKAKLVIELDGGGHYTDDQKIYDLRRTQFFEKMGLEVIRISNFDIDKNFYGVCSFLDLRMKQRMGILTPLPDSPVPRP